MGEASVGVLYSVAHDVQGAGAGTYLAGGVSVRLALNQARERMQFENCATWCERQ